SETPCFVGRAVAALAADPNVLAKSGGVYASWTLSDEYGFTDVDGNRPHWGRHVEEAFQGKSPFGPPKTGGRWVITRGGGATRTSTDSHGQVRCPCWSVSVRARPCSPSIERQRLPHRQPGRPPSGHRGCQRRGSQGDGEPGEHGPRRHHERQRHPESEPSEDA